MRNVLLDELEQFRKFVEKMDALVAEIENDENVKSGKYQLRDFDLRFTGEVDSEIFSIPTTLDDYFELWQFVKERYNNFLANDLNASEMFFDAYWNHVAENEAYFYDKVLWIYFDEEDGIIYEQKSEE